MDTNTLTLYRRRCSVTGEGMNSGWLFEDDHDTVKYERDVVHILREYASDYELDLDLDVSGRSDEDLLQAAFELNICYWTEWEDDIEDDDECYTLHGVPLLTREDRDAYLLRLPCTDVERAAVVLAHQGYMVWVSEGDGDDGKWSGRQELGLGNVCTLKMDDTMGVTVGDRDVQAYAIWYKQEPKTFEQVALDPDRWRFIGWQDIYKEHGPKH